MAYDVPQPPFSWTCPFCNHDSTIIENNFHLAETILLKDNRYQEIGAALYFVVCPNPKCARFTFTASLHKAGLVGPNWTVRNMIQRWKLIPPSEAKVFPDYVPKPIRDDYLEACLIRDLSSRCQTI